MDIKKISLFRIAAMLLTGCAMGFLLLTAVFCLPVSGMKESRETAEAFRREGDRPNVIPVYEGARLDNYTDAVMLAEAIFEDPEISPLRKAVYAYRRAGSDSAAADLAAQLEGESLPWVIGYTRYWHGFLVVLRPLLLLFSYADIRMLISSSQMVFFALFLVRLVQKNRTELALPFLAVVLTLSPTGTMISMQFFAVYAITMLGLMAVLNQDAWLRQGARYFYFFVFLGMLTCYFDFLTYPLVTLCLPLLLVLALHADEPDMLRFCIAACIAWGVGYIGLWALKWIAGSFLVGENLVRNAYYHTQYQVSLADSETGSRLEAITENIKVLLRPGYLAVYAGCALASVVSFIRRRGSVRMLFYGARGLMPLVGLVPFVWWVFAASHSIAHSFFTHRLLTITVFALMGWMASVQPDKEQKSDKKM